MKKYKVTGKYKGKKIEEIVSALSKKQAKLYTGFNIGVGGNMRDFISSKTIKAREQ